MKKRLRFLLPVLLILSLAFSFSGSALAKVPPEESVNATTRGAQMGKAKLYAMPDYYKQPAGKRGTVHMLPYQGLSQLTYAYVYLPYGYNPGNKYDIVYLMHGGGGNPGSFLNDARQNAIFANMVDHLIEEGKMRPVVIVAPTFYRFGHTGRSLQDSWDDLNAFPQELVECLIPAVEGIVSTYAETTDAAGLKASRAHRAFGGFSLGAVTTWEVMLNCIDEVGIYLPISGDCWRLGRGAGAAHPAETAYILAESVVKAGYTADDVLVYGFTGTRDGMEGQMSSQIKAMQQFPQVFNTNLVYRVREGSRHLLVDMDEHFFYVFQDVFPAAPATHR